MNIKYSLNIYNSAYNYNIEHDINEFGHFVTKRHGCSRQITVSGILKITQLHIYLILYYNNSSFIYQPLFGTITGILNNGLKIQIGPRYRILDHGYGEKFPIEKYLIHSIQISDSDDKYAYKMLGLKNIINIDNNENIIFNTNECHWFIYLNGLSEWAYYNNNSLNNINKFLNIGKITYNENTYDCGILFFKSKYNSVNNISELTTKKAVIELSSTSNSDISDIIDIAKIFCKLFGLFMNKFIIIDNILKLIGNNVHNVLFNMLNDGMIGLSYSPLNNTFYFNRIHYNMYYNDIVKSIRLFLSKYHKLCPIITSFFSDFNKSISNKTNLQKCVDGIGSYFNGRKYNTKNCEMSLASKLSNCFMWKFSSPVKNKVLGMTDNKQIKDYAQKIADTRNNLDHHDNRFEGNTLNNYPLTLRRLHCLTNCYLLNQIGISKDLINDFIMNMDSFE